MLRALTISKFPSFSRSFHCSAISQKKVALILNGCGVYDGSEIHEATSMLIHLDKADVQVTAFALNKPQSCVVNHATGSKSSESRNMLVESARIMRGKISPLEELDVKKFDAVFIPGGFGVATSLSTFAKDGVSCTVDATVRKVLNDFFTARKPMGLCCIAPVLAARCFPGAKISMGYDRNENGKWDGAGACEAIKAMGAVHENTDITSVCIDEKHKIVTSPAYMYSKASIGEVFDNVGMLVKTVLSL